MAKKNRRGRPQIYLQIKKEELRFADGKIVQFFKSKVSNFTSGAYIPISGDYKGHDVFVIVLEKKGGKNA